jgi:hypothetical protein
LKSGGQAFSAFPFNNWQSLNMNITERHNLSAVEKLKIIEVLWEDLLGDASSLPDLVWHETALKETEGKLLAGDIEVLDWQQAKKELRSQFE